MTEQKNKILKCLAEITKCSEALSAQADEKGRFIASSYPLSEKRLAVLLKGVARWRKYIAHMWKEMETLKELGEGEKEQ